MYANSVHRCREELAARERVSHRLKVPDVNETLTKVFQQDIGALEPVRLTVSTPDQPQPHEFELLHPYGIVGRSPNCDIRLKNEDVSFRHAYLQMIGGKLFCADLGSRSGTHWDSNLQRSGWLTSEESVRIGPYGLRLANDPKLDSSDFPDVPADFDPLAIYRDQLGPLPEVHLEFLNAADNVDLPIRRILTFAGSARGCKLRFEGDRISRVHCSLLLTPHGLWIIDLLGKGGTKVNGSLIRSDRLNDGDVLKVGQFQMRVRYQGEAGAPIQNAVLPAETTVETSSSTDEELSTASRKADVLPHPTLFELGQETPATAHCGHLIDKIVANKLLTRERIDEILTEFEAGQPTFDELSERLVERGLLSQWQADQLATENHGPLILENRYKILERLGFGSMGIVYRAFDEALQCDVAIKIPHNSLLRNERLFKRFRRETLISANLVHPHVVRALNIGRGNRFVVLELVDGDDLRDLIDRQGLPGEMMAVDFLIQVAEAVEFARRQGVVHRDVKPSNILVSRDGTAKLFDFGLAHLDETALKKGVAGEEAELIPTRPGFAVGTVQYMSPEQGEESDEVDCRSDIYSLGCTFYEMLTGTPPFEGDSQHEILRQHAQDPVPPIAGLDPGLAAILDKMLVKNREERYQTPRELVEALSQWQSAHDIAAAPETPHPEPGPPIAEEQLQQFQQQREQWQTEADAQSEELQQQREEFQTECERQLQIQQRQQQELEQKQLRLQERQRELEDLQSDIERRDADSASRLEELQAVQDQTAQTQQQLAQDLASLQTRQERFAEKSRDLETRQAELERAAAELEQQSRDLSLNRERLGVEQQQFAARRLDFENSLAAHQADTEQFSEQSDLLQEHKRQLEKLAADVAREQQELDRRATELQAEQAELVQQRTDLDRHRAESDEEAARLTEAQNCLSAAESEFAQHQSQLEQQRQELSEQQSQLADDRASFAEDRAALERKRGAFEQEIKQLALDKQELQQQRDEWAAAVETMQSEQARLEEERQHLAAEREQLVSDRTAMEARAQQLKDAVKAWFDGQ